MQARILRAPIGHGARATGLRGAKETTGQRLGDLAALDVRQRIADRLHHADGQRCIDALRGHRTQCRWRRGTFNSRIAVAGDALLLNENETRLGAAAGGRGLSRGWPCGQD